MSRNIWIIGPISAGKSTVAKEIAKRTNKALVCMDKEREALYPLWGYSEEDAEAAFLKRGIMGWYEYQKPFELESVKWALASHDDAVIDFGGGQSVYHQEAQADAFLRLMLREPYVFLLMPCESQRESLALLDERIDNDEEKALNRLFVPAETNRKAAKFLVLTKGKEPARIAEEIVAAYTEAARAKAARA